jgi:hypothetical protein
MSFPRLTASDDYEFAEVRLGLGGATTCDELNNIIYAGPCKAGDVWTGGEGETLCGRRQRDETEGMTDWVRVASYNGIGENQPNDSTF